MEFLLAFLVVQQRGNERYCSKSKLFKAKICRVMVAPLDVYKVQYEQSIYQKILRIKSRDALNDQEDHGQVIDTSLLQSQNVFTLKTLLCSLLLLSCCQSFVFCQSQESTLAAEPSTDPLKLFEPREYVTEEGEVLKYRLLKPADFNSDRKYPLVVFLHGAG
ncbi:MAG: hypothetical protein KDA72_21775, partial [Planctomycetales bacterium]|nr:hypothetical protein [Planctomycetales bacterium]